jgi:hypothetical protein
LKFESVAVYGAVCATLILVPFLMWYWQIASGFVFTPNLYAKTILSTGHLDTGIGLNPEASWYSPFTIGIERAYPLPSILYAVSAQVIGLNPQQVVLFPFLFVLVLLPFIWARMFGFPLWLAGLFEVAVGPSFLDNVYVSVHTYGFFAMWMGSTVVLLMLRKRGKRNSNLALLIMFVCAAGFSHYGATFLFAGGLAGIVLYQALSRRVLIPQTGQWAAIPFAIALFLFVFNGGLSYLGATANGAVSNIRGALAAYVARILNPSSIPTYTSTPGFSSPVVGLLVSLSAWYLRLFFITDLVIVAYLAYVLIRRSRPKMQTEYCLALFIFGTIIAEYFSYGIAQSPGTIYYGTAVMGLLLFPPLVLLKHDTSSSRWKIVRYSIALIIILTLVGATVGTPAYLSNASQRGLNASYPFEFNNLASVAGFIGLASTDSAYWASYSVSSVVTQYLNLSTLGGTVVNPYELQIYNISKALSFNTSANAISLMRSYGYSGLIIYKPEYARYTWGDINGLVARMPSSSSVYTAGFDLVYNDPSSFVVVTTG